MSRDHPIVVADALGRYAVAKVITKGANNPWDIQFLSAPMGHPPDRTFLASDGSPRWGE